MPRLIVIITRTVSETLTVISSPTYSYLILFHRTPEENKENVTKSSILIHPRDVGSDNPSFPSGVTASPVMHIRAQDTIPDESHNFLNKINQSSTLCPLIALPWHIPSLVDTAMASRHAPACVSYYDAGSLISCKTPLQVSHKYLYLHSKLREES
jgi:hypothetical protein